MLTNLCFVAGCLLLIIGSIWSLVIAARHSILWVLACLLVPFAGLIFLVKHWGEAWRPFLLKVVAIAVMLPAAFTHARNLRPGGAAAWSGGELPFPTLADKLPARPVSKGGLTRVSNDTGPAPRSNGGGGGSSAPGALAGVLQNSGVGRFQNGAWQPVDANALRGKKFFALYFSAHWCPPCRTFTPKLVAFYRQFAAAHPEFELVFVSSDRSEAQMRAYMQETGMPWPAVPFDKVRTVALPRSTGDGIPCLLLVDGDGRILSDSYAGSRYLGPQKVLNDIAKLPVGGTPGEATLAPATPAAPASKGEISPAMRRELAATEAAERRARETAEKQAAYAKHRTEADALYDDLNARRGKLKVDDAKVVAGFNADAARYSALLEQVRTEKLALDAAAAGPTTTGAGAAAPVVVVQSSR